MDAKKKQLYLTVDQDADEEARAVLDRLGLNVSTVVNALLKRIAAEGKVPFNLELTADELADLRLIRAVENANTPILHGEKEIAEYLLADEDDDY
jgi:DNA-damage-inducible protein J